MREYKIGDKVTVSNICWLPYDRVSSTTEYLVVDTDYSNIGEGTIPSVVIDTKIEGWEDERYGDSKYWWVRVVELELVRRDIIIGGELL